MSFYGNITSNPLTTYDKIYPNRYLMDQNASSDGVLPGRQILIEYDTPFDSGDLQIDLSEINGDYEKNRTIDATQYANKNYDSTVWKKIYANGSYYYAQIAELNGVGFRKAEFYNNNELIKEIQGQTSNAQLSLKASDGIIFDNQEDLDKLGIKTKFNFDTKNSMVPATVVQKADTVQVKIETPYMIVSPELQVSANGELSFDSSQSQNQELYEYFTIIDGKYREYDTFYAAEDSDAIIEDFNYLKDKDPIYVLAKNKFKLLGYYCQQGGYNVSESTPMALLRMRASTPINNSAPQLQGKVPISGQYAGYQYEYYDETQTLVLDFLERKTSQGSNAYLPLSYPTALDEIANEIQTIQLKINISLSSYYPGLNILPTDNFLTKFSQVKNIEINTVGNLTLEQYSLPNSLNKFFGTFNDLGLLRIEDDAIGFLTRNANTSIDIQCKNFKAQTSNKEGILPIIDSYGQSTVAYYIKYYGATEYNNASNSYLDKDRGYTIIHINPQVEILDLNGRKQDNEYIRSFHIEALKNLPNLTTINYHTSSEIVGYMIKGKEVNDVITTNFFKYRDTCKKLNFINNLRLSVSAYNFQDTVKSYQDGNIVLQMISHYPEYNLEYVAKDLFIQGCVIDSFNSEVINNFNKIISISSYAFAEGSLKHIDLPPGLREIKENTFINMPTLKSLAYRSSTISLSSINDQSIDRHISIHVPPTLTAKIKELVPIDIYVYEYYNNVLALLYETESYTHQFLNATNGFIPLPEVEGNYSYKENNTNKIWENREEINNAKLDFTKDTKVITQFLDTKERTITLYSGAIGMENDGTFYLLKGSLARSNLTYQPFLTTWQEIINKASSFSDWSPSSYSRTERYYFSTDNTDYKLIDNLSKTITETEADPIYIYREFIPFKTTLIFNETKEGKVSYESDVHLGWSVILPTGKPKDGYTFVGWECTNPFVKINVINGNPESIEQNLIEDYGYPSGLQFNIEQSEGENYLKFPESNESGTFWHTSLYFNPLYKLSNPKSDIRINNPIGFVNGNIVQINKLPLETFVNSFVEDTSTYYIGFNKDYVYDLALNNKISKKTLEGFTYNLSFSTLGTIKFKIEDSKLKCAFIDEEDNEIYLTQEESERILGKDYIKQTVVGLLKTKEE